MEGRGLLAVTVEIEQNPLLVMCTHWSLNTDDRMVAADLVRGFCAGKNVRMILAGDFNAFPDSPEIGRLRSLSGLTDSNSEHDRPTYPSDTPRARIDYIWRSPEIKALNLVVVDAGVRSPPGS